MKNPALRIVIGLLGIVVVVLGVLQMVGGSRGLPSKEEARQAARAALDNLADFIDAKKNFAMKYPKAWDTETPKEGPMLFKFKTFKGVVNASVMSQDVAEDVTLEAYVKSNVDAIRSEYAKQNLPVTILEQAPLEVSHMPAMRLSLAYVLPDVGVRTKVVQVYVLVRGRRAYAITWTAPEDLADELRELQQKVLDSVICS